MKFKYQARTKDGLIQIGIVRAPTKERAISILQSQGLYITYLEEESLKPFYLKEVHFGPQVTKKDIMVFARQLSIMLKSGISLVEALRAIALQSEKKQFREIILQIAEDVEGGTYFSDALSKFPRIFSQFFVNMVKSGEASGRLPDTLQYLATHLEKEYSLLEKIKGAMYYPIFVLVMLTAVLIFMFFYVFPKLQETFEPLGITFPIFTRFLFGLASFLVKWWWLILLILLGIFIFLWKYFRSKEGRELMNRLLSKSPIVSSLLKKLYLTRFAENLATLIYAGLPLTQALEIVSRVIGSKTYQKIIIDIQQRVRRGESLSSALEKYPQSIPSIIVQMARVGEKTGKLDEAFMKVAEFYRTETERTIEGLMKLIEPLLIVIVGSMVAILMLSIFVPIYSNIGKFGF